MLLFLSFWSQVFLHSDFPTILFTLPAVWNSIPNQRQFARFQAPSSRQCISEANHRHREAVIDQAYLFYPTWAQAFQFLSVRQLRLTCTMLTRKVMSFWRASNHFSSLVFFDYSVAWWTRVDVLCFQAFSVSFWQGNRHTVTKFRKFLSWSCHVFTTC